MINFYSTTTTPNTKKYQSAPRRQFSMAMVATLFAAPLIGLAAPTTPAQANATPAELGRYSASSTATVDHTAWTTLLQRYVKASSDGINRVDYAGFKSSGHKTLKSYIKTLEAVDPRTLGRNEQFAFWANLYNAKTIDVVLNNYPIDSIRKISINEGLFGYLKKSVGAGGPWKAKIMTVAGTKLSLDNIEHDIMRPVFKDPRVHYAVNCASYGCPNLARTALTGATLDQQLDEGAVAFVNHPRGIAVTNGKVTASSIYQWFQKDFGGTAQGVLAHANKYASPELKAKLKGVSEISSFAYDWSLNDTSKQGPQG